MNLEELRLKLKDEYIKAISQQYSTIREFILEQDGINVELLNKANTSEKYDLEEIENNFDNSFFWFFGVKK